MVAVWFATLCMEICDPVPLLQDLSSRAAPCMLTDSRMRAQLCYVTEYSGTFRGVLVTFGQQQFGHFPLGLFDEAMAKPPPSLQ